MKKVLFLAVFAVLLATEAASAGMIYEIYERGASTPLGNLVVGDRDELADTDRVPLSVVGTDGTVLELEARPVVQIDRTSPTPQVCFPFPADNGGR